MRAVLLVIPLAFFGLLTAGCAVPPPAVNLTPVESKLNRLDSDQQELSSRLERLQANLTLLEARLLDQQKIIETLRQGAPAQKVTPPGEKAVTVPPAAVGAPPGSPTEIYLQAFADYASGRFEPAIAGFEAFLRHYPNNDYAGNAQYWLGECYYSRQEYGLAVATFRKTVESYPQGGKAPDALLKMATALRQMNEVSQAEEALRLLRSRYPDTPAARKSLKTN